MVRRSWLTSVAVFFCCVWFAQAAEVKPEPELPPVRDPAAGGRPPQYGWRLDGEAFLRLGQGLETPHTRWMKPSAAGPIKALFLVNKIAAYDVGELARRLDIAVQGMPAETWLRLGDNYWLWLWHEDSSSPERSARFEAMLEQPYDVIVLGNYRFASLYESVQYKILQKVANGCGLVMFYAHDVDPRLLTRALPEAVGELSAGIPFAGLSFYRDLFMLKHDLVRPEQIGPRLFQACEFGRGRVLVVDYATQSSVFAAVDGAITPFEDYDYTAPVQYDYHQAMAARCLMWAARRQPRLAWVKPLPDGMEVVALCEPRPMELACTWSGPADTHLTRYARVRNRWGDVEHEDQQPLTAQTGTCAWTWSLPPLPGGLHFVDFIFSGKDGVENWGSFAVQVRAPLSIDAIEPADTFFENDQPVTGRVVLSRPVDQSEDVKLGIELEDGYGRVFSRAEAAAVVGADRVTFSIDQGRLLACGARLRMRLSRNGQMVHQEEVELRFRRPVRQVISVSPSGRLSRGAFPMAMWGAIPGYGNHVGNLQMRELGFTTILAGSPINQARDDLDWMTFGAGRGATIHSLGDEIAVPVATQGEGFGAFLAGRYTSIDALNAAWETKYGKWDDAEPVNGVADGSPASFVRYHESLAYGEFLHAERCRKGRQACEKSNPAGVVGPEGSPVGDPDLTLPEVTFWGPYLTVRDNLLVNAVADPNILRGNWFGGYVEDRQVYTRLRHVLWLSILGGNNMIEYFTVSGGLLAPDLTPMPFIEQFMGSWHQLRRGLGTLLAWSRPAGNPVALLHSQPSEHVGRAGGQWTDSTKVHEFMLNLLGDAGYSPQYVTAGQVDRDRLQHGDVKVLMLLHALALSDYQIKEITRFAEGGGTVIADIPPAWFDERCRLREKRGLDERFGLAPVKPEASLRRRLELMERLARVPVGEHALLLRGRDPDLIADHTGDGGLIQRPCGKGRFILLNGVVWQEGRDDIGTAQALRSLLTEQAKTPRVFQVAFREPLNKCGVKVYSYERNGAGSAGIWIDAVLPPEATRPEIPIVPVVTWPESKHTYDLRQERYLGHLDRMEQELERSSPLIVARLDYLIAAVKLTAPPGAKRGENLMVHCTVMDTDGKSRPGHVVRISVHGPDGVERPHYGMILEGNHATQQLWIPFALNDPPGAWRITATDIISGQSASASVELGE